MKMKSVIAANTLPADSYILKMDGISKSFKGLLAVNQYHLELRKGEILAIIGPNGAGKSTIFNLITGYLHPTSGEIWFTSHADPSQAITHLSPDKISRLGIGRTFQNIRLFSSMTVLENVMTARQLHHPYSIFSALSSFGRFLESEKKLAHESLEQLALFDLAALANVNAMTLPYGGQRRLEIVRALALRPRLMLLDEPTAGMSRYESMEILQLIRRVRDQYDLTIIIVEHNMPVVMQLCDRLQVMSYGQIIAEGTADEIRTNPKVIEAYLGKEEADVIL
jgi:branched-chain amino acid transport system ATP-binding protein